MESIRLGTVAYVVLKISVSTIGENPHVDHVVATSLVNTKYYDIIVENAEALLTVSTTNFATLAENVAVGDGVSMETDEPFAK